MVEIHPHGFLCQPAPSIATGVVGDLLVNETAEPRRPQVEMSCLSKAVQRQAFPCSVERSDRRGVGLGRWLEMRNRALEQQLVSVDVTCAELNKTMRLGHQHIGGFNDLE